MKEETIAFSTIPVDHLNRVEDRISFLYLEYCQIRQSDSGVVAIFSDGDTLVKQELQIPIAGICVLELGPGTSITNSALTSCSRSGLVVMFTKGGGIFELSTITPLTNSSKWAIAQASVVSDNTKAKKVAKSFYKKQFGDDNFEGSISQMRGLEGSLMKKIYNLEASKNRVKNFRRDTKSDDNINIALNIANNLLYGVSSVVVQSLSMNPALGVIHRGNKNSFLFDLADFYKPKIVIPIAFSVANEKKEDVPKIIRTSMRKEIFKGKLIRDLFNTVTESFKEFLPDNTEDTLISDHKNKTVLGHKNYSEDKNVLSNKID